MQENKIKISDLIAKRFDPYFHSPVFYEEMNLLGKSPYKLYKLDELCTQITDGTHYTPEYVKNGIKFISVKDIKENEIDFNDTKFITLEEHQALIKRCNPDCGDVLLTKIGTIGNVCVIPENSPNFSIFVSVALLKPRKDIITSKYLQVALSTFFAKSQMKRELKGIGVPDLHLENICNIQIPVPDDINEQDKIVEIYTNSYKNKLRKYGKAKDLLESINDILLKELNIVIPKIDNKKEFKTTISNILGSRLDPKYHQPKYETLAKYIKTNIKDLYSLEDICDEVISGQRPKGGVSQVKEGIPSLGGEHVLRDGTIETKNLKFIPEDFHKKQIKSKIKPLDIILVKDGATTGKVGIIPEEYPFKEANINEHVFILRCKKHINPYYILAFLLSEIGQTQIEREISGATIMGITKDSLKNILIPLPSYNTQILIANEYNMRLEQAQNLKKEADKEFEKSKARVERIILGEENL